MIMPQRADREGLGSPELFVQIAAEREAAAVQESAVIDSLLFGMDFGPVVPLTA
jgi:hypothetical protein